jgi:N-acetylglucosaminyldiphosphoundecaprenol N-acetyl-beta-D-mannosaminyltransferase
MVGDARKKRHARFSFAAARRFAPDFCLNTRHTVFEFEARRDSIAKARDGSMYVMQAGGETRRRSTIAGVAIDALSFDEVVDAVIAHAAAGGSPAYVVTPNAHHVVLLQKDELLRAVYGGAFLVVPDGVPLLWGTALLGAPLPSRVNGTDLFETLCARAARDGLRVFLLGGRPGAATAAAKRLSARDPALQVCGIYCPPFGFERDALESAKILAQIRAARPHLLFVGLGAPKQEYWMYRNCAAAGVPVSLGIGVSFELVGGVVARAPRWMQRAGLEWLYRLGTEPKRLWRRYVFGNAAFSFLLARQFAAQRIFRRRT